MALHYIFHYNMLLNTRRFMRICEKFSFCHLILILRLPQTSSIRTTKQRLHNKSRVSYNDGINRYWVFPLVREIKTLTRSPTRSQDPPFSFPNAKRLLGRKPKSHMETPISVRTSPIDSSIASQDALRYINLKKVCNKL